MSSCSGTTRARWRWASGYPSLPQVAPASTQQSLTLTLPPDPSLFDGSMANNAWLQECPTPFTKQVWGNALHVAETDARAIGVVGAVGAGLSFALLLTGTQKRRADK
jgi:hypothetical protein